MSCQVNSFAAIDQYLKLSQSHTDYYTDYRSSYTSANAMCLKNEDPFMANESYDKMLPPMMPVNYQNNVDSVPDTYLTEHSHELLDLDDIKDHIIQDFTQLNQIEYYNTDPRFWSEHDVQKWVVSKLNKYRISLDTVCWNRQVNGIELCSCSHEELGTYLYNQDATDIIYSELRKLKTEYHIPDCPTSFDYNSYPTQNNVTQMGDTFHAIQDYLKRTSSSTELHSPILNLDSDDSNSSSSLSPPPVSDCKNLYNQAETKAPRHKQNIHLWQFLKELLSEAEKHNNCIRWLNNKEGIFKIEDSAYVAKLWGQRKNRPAMNYDKLSRSLRQYYKKGIIQKTAASKRLVYQFGAHCM